MNLTNNNHLLFRSLSLSLSLSLSAAAAAAIPCCSTLYLTSAVKNVYITLALLYSLRILVCGKCVDHSVYMKRLWCIGLVFVILTSHVLLLFVPCCPA